MSESGVVRVALVGYGIEEECGAVSIEERTREKGPERGRKKQGGGERRGRTHLLAQHCPLEPRQILHCPDVVPPPAALTKDTYR